MLVRLKNKSAGFAVLEILIGIAVIGVALGMVGVARQKRETVKRQVQTSIEQAAQTRSKLEEAAKTASREEPQVDTTEPEEPTREIPKKEPKVDVKKDAPRLSKEPTADERKEKRPQTSSGSKGAGSFDVGSCFPGSPDPACTAIFGDYGAGPWYEQQQQEGTAAYYQQEQEAQQQLYEQYYYYEQQQQEMFDPNQFMQDPYQQYNPVLQDFYQQMLPDVYPQFFP